MKKDKLLKLIKYIKENDLIQRYNDIYKVYEGKNGVERPGFRLECIYSLTDEEVDLIISSKHQIEALFRLRMNSIGYKDLLSSEVKCDDDIVLKTIEDFIGKEDYSSYDKEKKIIKLIVKNDKNVLEKISYFLEYMKKKTELSMCGLSLDYLCIYLTCACKSKTFRGAKLITQLASSQKARTDYGLTRYSKNGDYHLKVIDKISECEKSFQPDYIDVLMRMQERNPVYNVFLLNNLESDENKIKIIDLFTKTENLDTLYAIIIILRLYLTGISFIIFGKYRQYFNYLVE